MVARENMTLEQVTENAAAEAVRRYEAELIERLARNFSIGYALSPEQGDDGRPVVDADQLGMFLGISEEEARSLLLVGLFSRSVIERSYGRYVPAADAVRFLKTHGRRWFEARWDRFVADLEEEAERIASGTNA